MVNRNLHNLALLTSLFNTICPSRLRLTKMTITSMNSVIRLFTAFLLLMSVSVQATTSVKASVDRNPVMVNESFVLEIVANDSLSGDELDLTPLQQSGLTIGRTATSSSTQIINGSISKSTTWSVVLLARKEGSYTIPALQVDGISSQPISVSVIKSSPTSGQANQQIFLKNTIEQTELYLQQTVKLVTRLYFAPNVDLQGGSLSDPLLESAFIKKHGEDKNTSEIIMGVRYRVIERVYTVTPQSSGKFTIATPAFNGEISTGKRRSSFSNFGMTKPITSVGNDIDINVASIPKDYSGAWLPSELVMLNDEWQPEKDTYEVGEPITRTFTLTALNVNEEQLPEIIGTYPDSFKTYPDQSESHSNIRQNAIVSQRVSSEAIVATKPGKFVLPEVSINWFNTKTKREEVVTLAAKTITITASTNSQSTPMTNAQTPLIEPEHISEQHCPAPNNTDNAQTQNNDNKLTQLFSHPIIAILGWALWLLTILAWFLFHRFYGKQANNNDSKDSQLTKADTAFNKARLKQACVNGEANLVRSELLKWAKSEFTPSVLTLGGLIPLVSPELQKHITLLQSHQYSKHSAQAGDEQWSGKALWKAFKSFNSTEKTTDKTSLPPLNNT